jgi:hypothetical protein
MKKKILLALAGILAAGSLQAGVRVGLLGGYAFSLDSASGRGFAAGLGASFDIDRRLSLEFGVLYLRRQTVADPDKLSPGAVGLWPVEVRLKFRIPLGTKGSAFYLGLGGGYALAHFGLDAKVASDWEDLGFAASESVDSAPCLHAGCGLEWALGSKIALVLDARYMMARTQGSWQMVETGSGLSTEGRIKSLNLDAVMLNLGLNYSF